MVQSKIIAKRERQWPNSPMDEWKTKFTYRWTVQCKVILKREVHQPNSPIGGESNIKSSPRRKDNEQSQLQVDDQIHVIPKREGWILESSYLEGERIDEPSHHWSHLGDERTKSPRWRMIQGILHRWSTQVEIV